MDRAAPARAHGTFNVVGGLWPLRHMKSFEWVLGPAALSMHEMIEDAISYPALTDVSSLVPIAHAGEEEREMFPEVRGHSADADLERIDALLSARLARLRASRLTQLRLRLKREVVRRTYARPQAQR